MKALVGPFNKEEARVEAFSVIVKSSRTFVYSSNEVSRGCEAVGVSHLYLPGVEHHVGDTGVGQGGDQLLVAVLGQEEHGDTLHSHLMNTNCPEAKEGFRCFLWKWAAATESPRHKHRYFHKPNFHSSSSLFSVLILSLCLTEQLVQRTGQL